MGDGFDSVLCGISHNSRRCMINSRKCVCATIYSNDRVTVFTRELFLVNLPMGTNFTRDEIFGARRRAQMEASNRTIQALQLTEILLDSGCSEFRRQICEYRGVTIIDNNAKHLLFTCMAPDTMLVSNEIKGRVELDSVVSCDAIGFIETGWFLYISFYL